VPPTSQSQATTNKTTHITAKSEVSQSTAISDRPKAKPKISRKSQQAQQQQQQQQTATPVWNQTNYLFTATLLMVALILECRAIFS